MLIKEADQCQGFKHFLREMKRNRFLQKSASVGRAFHHGFARAALCIIKYMSISRLNYFMQIHAQLVLRQFADELIV
jgi:hypothetical protein